MVEPGKASASVSARIARLGGISGQGRREAAFTLAWEKWSRRNKVKLLELSFEISTKKDRLLSKGDQGESII